MIQEIHGMTHQRDIAQHVKITQRRLTVLDVAGNAERRYKMDNNRLDFLQLAKIAKERGTLTPALYRSYSKAYARAAKKEGYAQ